MAAETVEGVVVEETAIEVDSTWGTITTSHQKATVVQRLCIANPSNNKVWTNTIKKNRGNRIKVAEEEAVGVIIVEIILIGEVVVEEGAPGVVEPCLIVLETGLRVEEAEVISEEALEVEVTSEVDFEVAEVANGVAVVEVLEVLVFLFQEVDFIDGKITTMKRKKKTHFFDQRM